MRWYGGSVVVHGTGTQGLKWQACSTLEAEYPFGSEAYLSSFLAVGSWKVLFCFVLFR